MKVPVRSGRAFGSYRATDIPQPTCGPENIAIEIKATTIRGTDIKHYNVDNGSDELNSIRGHESAGYIAQVGKRVKGWKVG